ncbi:hypothetical protein [uncultured Thiodictyon sp.]|uniref:hypothetical protein n=1 Tax=uncultured Thiodictyon sp. TaxID=1846217 RepID=UPI0025E21685|nr:hypothetical protein [uncultured Thiodictyon sp.]
MQPKLVPDNLTAPLPEDLGQPGMEPIFWQGADHNLLVPDWYPPGPMIEHLAYSVARTPADLTAHTRRVLLCLNQADPAALFGSLADLFIALGQRGEALRRRLFDLARPLLPEAQARPLAAWLEQGGVDDRVLPDDTHAVLAARPRGRPLILAD